jgi:hypothetical protein
LILARSRDRRSTSATSLPPFGGASMTTRPRFGSKRVARNWRTMMPPRECVTKCTRAASPTRGTTSRPSASAFSAIERVFER